MIGVRGAVTYPRSRIERWILASRAKSLAARARGLHDVADKYMDLVDQLLDDWAISE